MTRPGKLHCISDSRSREENVRLANLSKEETEEPAFKMLHSERAFRCPVCNRITGTVFSDIAFGHISLRCKCGVITVYNTGVFYSEKHDDSLRFTLE